MSIEQVAALLRGDGAVDDKGLAAARERAAKAGEDLASACWSLRLAPEAALVKALAVLHGFPGVDLSHSVIRLANLDLLPEDAIRRKLVLPVLDADGELVVAMADPDDVALYDELRFLSGRKVLRHVAVPAALRAAIDGAFKALIAGESEWRGRDAWKLEPPPEGKAAVVRPPEAPQPQGENLPLVMGRLDTSSSWLDSFFQPALPPQPRLATPVPPPRPPAPAGGPPGSDQPPAEEARKTLKVEGLGSGKTALVVEDDPEMRALEVKLLAPFKCAVVQAGDGKEGLALARELRPDLVLLDAMLPGMHGFEICRAIKGDPELRKAGVIFITGIYGGWRVGADLKEVYGADYFFEKPFRVDEVSRAVRVLLLTGSEAESAVRAKRAEALATCREAQVRAEQGKPTEAVALLQAAVQKDPFSAEPHYLLAQALRQLGQPYQALAELERAVELRPDLDTPLVHLGDLYSSLGFRKTAREVLIRALDVSADETRRGAIRERLARLAR